MVKRSETSGKCNFCKELIGFSSMTQHLLHCEHRKKILEPEGDLKNAKYYGLKVWATDNPSYWLFLEVHEDASFDVLDHYLRQVWLECCNHLSAFSVGDVRYETVTDTSDFMFPLFRRKASKSMDEKFGKVLSKGLEFHYEYDFGSTTDLELKVVWEREGKWNKNGLSVLSRNEPIVFQCVNCRQTAEVVCTECGWEKEASYCDQCAAKHKCGGDMLLPIVNSPRMGVCGYCGDEGFDDEDQVEELDMNDAIPVMAQVQSKAGRNEPCPCGSGKKYKKCCLS